MSKRLFISTLATLLISASAEGFAADMAVKAPPVVAPPPPAWTGFYIGGNVGYGRSQKEFIDNFEPPIGAEDGSVTANGVVGGIQGGYNYQIGAFLLGIDGGFTWSGASGTFSCFPLLAPQTCTASPQWLADVAGRLGVIWNSPVFGDLLFYGKGGPAFALPGAPKEAFPGVLFSASET